MNDGVRISGPHIIKLQDKRIKVQLQYHSPPKKDNKTRVREVTLYQHNKKENDHTKSNKKIHHLNSIKSIKRFKLNNASPYYYYKRAEESQHLVADYELFHQKMMENEAQRRKLKVYSNSKQLIAAKQKSFSKVMTDKNNNSKQYSGKPIQNIPLRKIKLYSPIKGKQQQKENIVKPLEKSIQNHEIRIPRTIKLQNTPNRRYKLEVTSSKSRNKNDSILSKQQKSIDVSKQIRSRFEEETPQRFVDSFNSMSLNEH